MQGKALKFFLIKLIGVVAAVGFTVCIACGATWHD